MLQGLSSPSGSSSYCCACGFFPPHSSISSHYNKEGMVFKSSVNPHEPGSINNWAVAKWLLLYHFLVHIHSIDKVLH